MRSYNLIKEVAKYHDVTLLAFYQKKMVEAYFPSVEKGLGKSREHFSGFCVQQQYFPIGSDHRRNGTFMLALRSLFSRTPYTINWLSSKAYSDGVRSAFSGVKYDLVHFDTISLAPYKSLIGETPSVLNHHNIESLMMLRRARNEQSLLKRLYFYQEGKRLLAYEKSVTPTFTVNITCSDNDGDQLKEVHMLEEVKTIPNGINMSAIMPSRIGGSSLSLLFIGGLDWYPNASAILHFLKDVWPTVSRRYPDLIFDVVGKNPPKHILDIAANDGKVNIHGYVDDISAFYSRASCYVCPIRDGGGTKLKVLDALAHKVPLVGYKEAYEGIHVVNNMHCLMVDSVSSFVDAISKVLDNKEGAQSMADAGYALIQEVYDFEAIGARLAQYYGEIVDDSQKAGCSILIGGRPPEGAGPQG